MTRDELLAGLRALDEKDLRGDADPESDHGMADQMLLAFIDDPEVTAAFDAIRKWYS